MSRRARRQQEELLDLQGTADQQESANGASISDDSHDDEGDSIPQASTSKFGALSAALGQTGETDDDDDDEQAAQDTASARKSKKKRNKKKKKPVATDDTVTEEQSRTVAAGLGTTTQASPAASKPNTPKKNNQKSKPQEAPDDGLDEIDRALQQLGAHTNHGTQGGPDSSNCISVPIATSRIRSLLSVETSNLDADAELKRFFGAKVVASAEARPQVRGARALNPHHALHRQYAKGGILAKPKPAWPPAAFSKSGLSMELVEAAQGETLWTFEHSRGYKEVTQMYLEAVASMDPNQMMALLHVHPYHVETLLGLSDMAAQQGDPGMSQDFLDRALYAFEKAFAPNFSIQNGNARLDFGRIESRGFYRALEKRISSMSRRGTWRTLFEHTKLLYSLSPFDDPYGALLFLDFTAPKAHQYTWLIDFVDELPSMLNSAALEDQSHLVIDSFPGLHYARALSLWHKEESTKSPHEESTASLRRCILRYPLAAHLLLQKLQLSVPNALATLAQAQPETGFSTKASYVLQLLSHLYVHRSDTLWREPEVLQWFQATLRTAAEKLGDSSHPDVMFGKRLWVESAYPQNGVPQGILRHILVSDIQILRQFLPHSVLNSMSFVFDPLPPGPGFDDAYFKSMYEGRQRPSGGPASGTSRSEPSADTRGMLQRLVQFMQAENGGQGLDRDTEAALITQLEQLGMGRAQGGLPGQFPVGEQTDSDEEGGRADRAPEATGEGNQGVMNFLRGLWGGNTAQAGAHDPQDLREDDDDE